MFEIKIEGWKELLHIPEPWYIDGVNFHVKEKQLDVYVKVEKSALFRCSACGESNQRVKDVSTKTILDHFALKQKEGDYSLEPHIART